MDYLYWGEPFAHAYLTAEGDSQILRIARGLLAQARTFPIQAGLGTPIVGAPMPQAFISYTFGSGIAINHAILENPILPHGVWEELSRLRDSFQSVETRAVALASLTEHEKECAFDTVFWAGFWGGHILLDYSILLAEGTNGIRARIAEKKKQVSKKEESQFLAALEVTCEALESFCDRYADATQAAETAEICWTAIRRGSRGFREALQAFWLAFTFDGIDSPGRFDQYMLPYLTTSLDNGELTTEEAERWLVKLWDNFERERVWNLCIGGQTTDGRGASNILSHMILRVQRKTGYRAPNLTMRVFPETPDSLWREAVACITAGLGLPALYNDEVVIPALVNCGIPVEDARGYAMNGCNQIDIPGLSNMGLEDGELNLLKCLELALNDGCCRITGKQLGPRTGDPRSFVSFEQVVEAYDAQVEYFTKMLTEVSNKWQHAIAQTAPAPYRSLLITSCLDSMRPSNSGGAKYNFGQVLCQGIANTVDSLMALKQFVFEEKRYTMDEVMDALNKNYEGSDRMLMLFRNRKCAFGNDCADVDELAAGLVSRFFCELAKHKTYRGGVYGGGCSTFNRAAWAGTKVAATPDGRRALDPLADSIGAAQGRDRNGPTALLNSAACLPAASALSGFVLNLRFDRRLIAEGSGNVLQKLIEVYFQKGGQQVQVDVTNREDLLDAIEHPERHGNLIVRVGGFSARFNELGADVQREILTRSAHGL